MPEKNRLLPTDPKPPKDKGYDAPQLDLEKYRDDISEYYPTLEQQDEVLRILWDIMKTFVDIGWGVDGVQMVLPELFEKAGADSGKLVEQKEANIFNAASDNHSEKRSEK